MQVYIKDFCEHLNYQNVILYVDEEVNLDGLYSRLRLDNVNHLSRFYCIRCNRLMYIENCDLQDVGNASELYRLLVNGYSILHLKVDSVGYYIDIPDGIL